MIQTLTTWIHQQLEYVIGALTGILIVQIDVGEALVKVIWIVLGGFLGGFGAWLWKVIEKKLKRK